jgi:hypothetical protein
MRRLLLAMMVFAIGLILPFAAASAGSNSNAKILIHLLSPTTKDACTRSAAAPACTSIVTSGDLYPHTYFAYLLVTDADSVAGLAGVQCGISYNGATHTGVDVFSWTNCATLEFPSNDWPASGSGTIITWAADSSCQRFEPGGSGTGVTAVAGYFYCAAYGADTLRVIRRPVDAMAKVSDCAAVEDIVQSEDYQPNPSHLGFAVFSSGGQAEGYSPCGAGGNDGVGWGGEDGGGGGQDTGGAGGDSPGEPPSPDGLWTQAGNNTFTLNDSLLSAILDQVPMEFSISPSTFLITFPMPAPATEFIQMIVAESPILSTQLADSRPELRTFALRSPNDSGTTGRMDWMPNGLHAVIFTATGGIYVAPGVGTSNEPLYESNSIGSYEAGGFRCTASPDTTYVGSSSTPQSSGDILSTFRIAINATSGYTDYLGSTTAAEQQIVTTVNILSALYEREATIRFSLVYFKAYEDSTDPFSNGQWNEVNQVLLDSLVGDQGYDLGHVFGFAVGDTVGGGLSQEPGACRSGLKGKANSSIGNPTLSYFATGVVAHEVGHQFNATHTCSGYGCTSGNCGCHNGPPPPQEPPAGPEPGGGSTIMAETVCVPNNGCNLQGASDPYFHTSSLERIINYTAGLNCQTRTSTSNSPPQVSVPSASETIPPRTPFILTATATDANSQDSLSFCWEQNDIGADPSLGIPFRSRAPSSQPYRYFPRLADLLAHTVSKWETLPDTVRSYTFRITVRDNHPGAGGIAFNEVAVNVVGDDPFYVTAPTTVDSLAGGDSLTVQWHVGDGSIADFVDIILLDGVEQADVIAAATANDGEERVAMPTRGCSRCRIMVKATTGIFFSVSDSTFAVSGVGDIPTQDIPIGMRVFPNPSNRRSTIEVSLGYAGYKTNVLIDVFDVAGRHVRRLHDGPSDGGITQLTWDGTNDAGLRVTQGLYFVRVAIGGVSKVQKLVLIR